MSEINVVVTDLDGTLWDANELPHEKTLLALDEVRRRGIILLVATGRRRRSAHRALERAGLDFLPAVLLDGAIGCRNFNEVAIFHCPFTDAEVRELLAVFADFGEEPIFETDDFFHDRLSGQRGGDYHHLLTDETTLRCDLQEALPLPGFSAVTMVRRSVATSLVEALNSTKAGLAWIAFEPPQAPEAVAIRIRPPRCSKWSGICQWLDHHGLEPSGILAIGDNDNDVEMLDSAAISIAMETGSTAAKATASHVAPSPELGGWAAVLDHLQ